MFNYWEIKEKNRPYITGIVKSNYVRQAALLLCGHLSRPL